MQITEIARSAEKFTVDNSPLLLTAVGVAGVATTAILAGKASIRAYELIAEDETENDYFLNNKHKFLLVWPQFIPAAGVGLTTIVCIIGANRIGTRRAAAMAAAYTLSERAFEEYKVKVIDKFSKNKEREVRDEILQDRVTANPPVEKNVIYTGGGEVLCYDKFSGRYFRSDMETIKKAVNDLNYTINNHMYASLNDFYGKLGLDSVQMGEELGWTSDELLEVYFGTTISDRQTPCIAIEFVSKPVRDYFRTH